jgi:hypothetical protein
VLPWLLLLVSLLFGVLPEKFDACRAHQVALPYPAAACLGAGFVRNVASASRMTAEIRDRVQLIYHLCPRTRPR